MKVVEISTNDHLPAGKYQLLNTEKLERAMRAAGEGASERKVLIEYDKLAGLILNESGQKVEVHTLWNAERNAPEVRKRVLEWERQWNRSRRFEWILNAVLWLPTAIIIVFYNVLTVVFRVIKDILAAVYKHLISTLGIAIAGGILYALFR